MIQIPAPDGNRTRVPPPPQGKYRITRLQSNFMNFKILYEYSGSKALIWKSQILFIANFIKNSDIKIK